MALARFLAGTAERDALIKGAVVSDYRGLADDDPGAVVDEKALSDLRGRVYLDPCEEFRELRQRTGGHVRAVFVERVRGAVKRERVKTGIKKDDLKAASRGGVALADRIDVSDDGAQTSRDGIAASRLFHFDIYLHIFLRKRDGARADRIIYYVLNIIIYHKSRVL